MEQDVSTDPAPTTTYNILFVCTGNTCRSPMAEAVAREELGRLGWSHVQVGSAGVAAQPGYAASTQAVNVLGRKGIDLSPHASRPLTRDLVEWADLILAMSPGHLSTIAQLGGEEKMALLGEFAAGAEGGGRPVRDPFGGDEAEYENTYHELVHLVQQTLERLAPILHP